MFEQIRSACAIVCILIYAVESTTTKYFTYEEDSPGTEIGNLSQDLRINPAEDPLTSFRFMQDPNSSLIHLRQNDGLLTVGEIIDRELLCPRAPRCLFAFDIVAFAKERFQLIHVEIEVKDINDNSPKFPRNDTYLEILENVALGSRFPLDVAVDQDVGNNYIQSYQISSNSYFRIEAREGDDGIKRAELVLVKKLDREVEDFYTIQVTAVDGGSPNRTGSMAVYIRVLDFNDNSPTFQHNSLKVELYEDAPVGFLILNVHASDPDDGINGEVMYSFVEESLDEVKQIFHIDPFSGAVILKALVDYETKRSYELNIQAYDLGLNSIPSTCKVAIEIVDVNDNLPEIGIKPMTSMSDGVAYITESAAKESFVALISTSDRDSGSNGYVRCSLHGHEHFKLQAAYGDTVMIVTTTTLDRERIPEYNLTVAAEDLGSPPFKTIKHYTIRVTDDNDNAPLFSKAVYEVSVIENNNPGSYIATVIARDLDMGDNGMVTYQLIDGEVGVEPLSTLVSVDPVSGSLYTVRSLDYESMDQIEVHIKATDSGSPPLSSTTLIRIKVIDQNDNAPYITHPVLHDNSAEVPVPYNAPPGYVVLQVKAQDADEGVNSQLKYQILKDEQKLFSINKDSGEISLKYGLASMIGDVLLVKIAVSDSGRSPLSSCTTVRFVVTEMQPVEEQIIAILDSFNQEKSELDISLIIITILGGGCALLLIAIVAVALSCALNCKGRKYDSEKNSRRGPFGTSPLLPFKSQDSNMFIGPRALVNEQVSLSTHESSKLYQERRDSQTKVSLSSFNKSFEPASLWQCGEYSLQLSGATDQLSVKDSGKGDSDFNDSDSDISGDGCRKNRSVLPSQSNSTLHPANILAVDHQDRSIPAHTMVTSNGYTIAFSQVLAARYISHANPCSWRDSACRIGVSGCRTPLQPLPQDGSPLPPQPQQEPPSAMSPGAQGQQSQDVSAIAALVTTSS